MRWQGRRESENVEDRRSTQAGFSFPGLPIGGRGGLGLGGLVVIVILSLVFGIDPMALLSGDPIEIRQGDQGSAPSSAETDALKSFASVVLADTEDTWTEIFEAQGGQYENPKLVLFSGAVQTGCGYAGAAAGPFYCPPDRKVYLDLSFFDELKTKFGAPGDFAGAYVIAHEVGHHVQNLLGIADKVRAAQARAGEAQANGLSVRLELQADCFAGVWANHADRSRQILEAGDVEEALRAAAAVGDDTLQKAAEGRVVPETFTHGSAEQRARWFRAGFSDGTLEHCDTFNANPL